MALKNLFKRKVRTFLTVLGVVIGTAAIIIMVSLGIGVNLGFEQQMKQMGDVTLIRIYNWEGYYGGGKGAPTLDDEFIRNIQKDEGVEVATPVVEIYIKAVSGRYSTQLQIRGMKPEALGYLGFIPAEGRSLEADDEYEVVFGADVPYNFQSSRSRNMFFWGQAPDPDRKAKVNVLKDRIQISPDWNFGEPNYTPDPSMKPFKPINIKGVGILQRNENNYESVYYSFMNLDTVLKLQREINKWQQGSGWRPQKTYGYEQAIVKCTSIEEVERVLAVIKGYGFQNTSTPIEYIKSFQEMTASLQALLGAIGGVSLFVAAIGITNTMIMSIYERTREIGVMKVIGAALKDIQKLFLIEAALIGLLGGIFGIGLSFLVSYILNNVGISFFSMLVSSMGGSDISVIPMWLALGGLGFAAAIGLVSGYLPARRAMKLSALSAIRAE